MLGAFLLDGSYCCLMNIKRRKIIKGKILGIETKCVFVFEYFQTEEFAS